MSEFLVMSPCYNEDKYIDEFVRRAMSVVKKNNFVVIDDGSIDNTYNILKGLNINVIRSEHRGKGAAIWEGIQFARKNNIEYVVFLDADLQHPPEFIPAFLNKLKAGYDIVIGSRWRDLGLMPWDRYLSNRITTFFVSLLVGKKLIDTQSGYRGYRLSLFDNIVLRTKRYETETEILIKLMKGRKVNVAYVDIPAIYNEGTSKIHRLKDTLRFMKMYFELLWKSS